MNINKMREDMINRGIISIEDIERICELEKEYEEECEKIAEQCEEEGYPSHGSNYGLRCENAREYYDQEIDYILDKYDFD